jgi:microcystin-dependent protein
MAQPYVGEVRMFAGNFAPAGWAFCDGSLQSIAENETLFQLIGTTYGGDGQNTFALPDLRGRIPLHMGSNAGTTYTLGQQAGTETVVLTPNQIPVHSHTLQAVSTAANKTSPTGHHLAALDTNFLYIADVITDKTSATIEQIGGNQLHSNVQPYLCLNFIISYFGIFPSPS